MLTVQGIKTIAETFTGTTVTITNDKAISAMALASMMIGRKSGFDYEISSASYTENVWNDNILPASNLGITEVNADDGYNSVYTGWKRRGRDVLFNNSGDYIIHYKQLPTKPTTTTSTIEVHDAYEQLLWEFMIGYSRLSKWEGEDGFGQQLIADFKNAVNEVWSDINKGKGSAQMVSCRHS